MGRKMSDTWGGWKVVRPFAIGGISGSMATTCI